MAFIFNGREIELPEHPLQRQYTTHLHACVGRMFCPDSENHAAEGERIIHESMNGLTVTTGLSLSDLRVTGKYIAPALLWNTVLTIAQICQDRGRLIVVCTYDMPSWLNAETPTTTTMSKGWDLEEFLREAIPVT